MSSTDQLLILAPRGRDAQVIAGQLTEAGMTPVIAVAAEIVAAVRAGELGAAIVADEAMATFDLEALALALASQPPWSDSPFVVLTRREFGGWTRARLAALLGNVTMLERPLGRDVLISGARSALRARTRQRRAEVSLREREIAEAQVRELAATLESRVAHRTEALSKALADRAHTQRRLRDSEELYRYTVELTGQTPWTADSAGTLLGIGPGWANRTRQPARWQTLVHPDDLDAVRTGWSAAVATATPFVADYRLRAADGSYGWCRSRAAPRLAADGTVVRWYGTLEDIDERRKAADSLRQMQAELIHVSRLSAMGAMASTLAHELNQPLTAIANYVRGSRRMLVGHPDYDVVRDALDAADRNSVRAAEIVRRVRQLVTKGDVQRQPEDLSALVREACTLAMIDARSSGIDFRLRLEPAATDVLVDRVQIQQVLLNLLRNAAEAVAAMPVRRVTLKTRTKSDDYCEISVIDTGPGVPAGSASQLFKPFNTTKADGMGIGLSISRTIVEAHGGTITGRNGRSGGARFRFTLPRASVTPAGARTPS